jgi:hypothetical protein
MFDAGLTAEWIDLRILKKRHRRIKTKSPVQIVYRILSATVPCSINTAGRHQFSGLPTIRPCEGIQFGQRGISRCYTAG